MRKRLPYQWPILHSNQNLWVKKEESILVRNSIAEGLRQVLAIHQSLALLLRPSDEYKRRIIFLRQSKTIIWIDTLVMILTMIRIMAIMKSLTPILMIAPLNTRA